MKIHTLASGSSGNCLLVSHENAHVLVDAGISCRRITTALAQLGLTARELCGVLVTHEHSDHISGLKTLTKQFSLPIYTAPGTAWALAHKIPETAPVLREVSPDQDFDLASFRVSTFATSHDAAEPMGFSLEAGGRKASVVTDLGYVSDSVWDGICGSDLLVCEANHDVNWVRSGPYPPTLQQRVLGDLGHLSNEVGGHLARHCVERGTHTVLLAHLSAENNSPGHALLAVEAIFRSAGIEPGKDVTLAVAPRNTLSEGYEV